MDQGAFQIACKLSELASGDMRAVELDGRRVLIANVDGEIFATDDTCTHEDASLAGGSLTGRLVRCPLHGSRFDLRTGVPLEEPAEVPLACYPTRIEGGDVLVSLTSS